MNIFLRLTIATTTFLAAIAAAQCPSQNPNDEPVCLSKINIGGPRLGLTGIIGNGDFAHELDKNKIGRYYSQFGWQFEFKVVPEGNGPSFVIELIPMIGAVEYGIVVPSITVPLGIRMPNGFEFGIGPNVCATSIDRASSSVVIALGKTFSYRGVGIPINFAVAKGSGGVATTLSFGYALVRSKISASGSASY